MDIQTIMEQGVLGFLFTVFLFYTTRQSYIRENNYLVMINKLTEKIYLMENEINKLKEVQK